MIGPHDEAGRLERANDAPERLPREKRRSALHGHGPLGGQPLLQEAIEPRRVELAQGIGIGIGKIDDDRVEGRAGWASQIMASWLTTSTRGSWKARPFNSASG